MTGNWPNIALNCIGMPKMKSHSGMSKRLAVTAGGKLKRRRAQASHLMEHKSTDRKREKHGVTDLAKADHARVKKMLGI